MTEAETPAAAGTILVVDDMPANVDLLRRTLEPEGYEVLAAGSGETALKVAAIGNPDVVLLDINMPGMDGFETCRALKNQAATAEIPVIFITANDATAALVEGFRAGGVDFVTKPFRAEEVLIRVETHLKVHRLARTLARQNEELSRLNTELRDEISRRRQAEQSLSLIEEQRAERFHSGGTLGPNAPSYVERQADRDLLAGLLGGEFCHVLTSRQMGKSSLMVRAAKHLRERQFRVATLDLTALGQNLTPEQWYWGLLTRLGWQLDLEAELEDYWLQQERCSPVQRFFGALRDQVLRRGPQPLAVFVDELDVVRSLPFRCDEFFSAIREQYNARSQDSDLEKLTFCLLGVAAPRELMCDSPLTPFNIGRRVELLDFSRPEIAPFAKGLCRESKTADELLSRIHFWTRGHPYLTQKLCKGVVGDESVQTPAAVDDLCHRLFLSREAREQDDNLIFVRERLLRSDTDLEQLLDFYQRILAGDPVGPDDSEAITAALRLSGIVRIEEGQFRPRNRIYEEVFDRRWIAATQERMGHAAGRS